MDKQFTGTYFAVMRNRNIGVTATICMAIAFCQVVTTIAGAQEKIDIVHGPEFYFSVAGDDGYLQEYQSRIVPIIPRRVCYGWRLRLVDTVKLVQFTEEFSLPSEPDYWSNEDDSYATNVISEDRKTSVTNRFVVPEDGWIWNEWCVAEGDPTGTYRLTIFIEEILVDEFDFEVVSLADYRKHNGDD